jgi:hypothetical protein
MEIRPVDSLALLIILLSVIEIGWRETSNFWQSPSSLWTDRKKI